MYGIDAHGDEQRAKYRTQYQDGGAGIEEHADHEQEQVGEKQQYVDVVARLHHAACDQTGEPGHRDDPGEHHRRADQK
jgi:hypothetical protein